MQSPSFKILLIYKRIPIFKIVFLYPRSYIMQLICSSDNFLTSEQEQLLSTEQVNIVHKVKLTPIYIIEAQDIDEVVSLGLFKGVRKAETFSVAEDVKMYPNIPNTPLIRKLNAVGWGGIKVAILDTGVRPEQISVTYSKDFTGYNNIIIHDHGTKVAKIINHYSPRAHIMSFKVGHEGNDIKEGAIFMALDDVMEQGANIVNMSISFGRGCKGKCELCTYLDLLVDSTGIIVVTAAGNKGQLPVSSIGCPGAAEKVITVGAVDHYKMLASFSSIGEPGFDKPNILAPGYTEIKMRYPSGFLIGTDEGTSFATPVVVGVLTSLFSIYLDKSLIITKMYQTCECIGIPRHEQGFGLLNLEKLVEVCLQDDAISRTDSRQKST
ncbi:hypothetical protein JIMMER1_42 [Brevibacillus phage Jimmer1]|uniref:Peptidase S8/S53 domain-containing protein n=4 Tax=Jimmervirus TaxID=1984788 RepID=S5MTP5_9CAUD|nr:protease [Brevibacillus phage Osiris]YP_009226352.1 protease [Brevibacillus phage Jimmer1]YP_009606469.1 protease [Brevibacillus phage Jimmer2]ALA48054.1 hypothetical protein POWDER_44 [Brevibacillus phage Powder]AGR47182.1 hypothetical protein JIMMER2_42 [Brevibacillus phage Jimmer2]AGR47335.1 hypothetical protein JIMMER1_42 [Brevibacillus phage Jimmer1]ALA07336.1 hypothetical protein OSIRIS_44 [Brevibacillus phage Osiris]